MGLRRKRRQEAPWDARVEAWVADGVSKGFVARTGSHTAYDGHTQVPTLVVKTTAVRRLYTGEDMEIS